MESPFRKVQALHHHNFHLPKNQPVFWAYKEPRRQPVTTKPHQNLARALLSDRGHRAVLPPLAPRRRAHTTERPWNPQETQPNLSSPLPA